jgi:hypothetical protein
MAGAKCGRRDARVQFGAARRRLRRRAKARRFLSACEGCWAATVRRSDGLSIALFANGFELGDYF